MISERLMYLTVEQVCRTYHWTRAYVYKQARKKGWRRITVAGKVRYLATEVDDTYWSSRDEPGVKSA